ncbi:hypothetical protein [Legionella anisa]|uniref:hypothetical protein n=1 Tax=Legionella anisa TaxID=28082 RepID=UPI001041AD5E|nr:hypothetical protein [Legionella anisa]
MLKNLDPFAWSLNLLEYIGNNVKTPAETFKIEENIKDAVCNEIGLPTEDRNKNFDYICEMLLKEELVTSPDKTKTYRRFIVTPEGWKKHHAISSGYINTKQGFMAMPFAIDEITRLFNSFRTHLATIDYQLDNPLLTKPEAGNIDSRLELEIRKSKFVVVDLTHDNNGAYWEAGFAYGLGKKVFYTCKKGSSTHFDVNHHHTLFWESDKLDEAAKTLRDTISNTFNANF